MNESQSNNNGIGISLEDIYYVLFRHKYKIAFCCLAGLMAAATFWVIKAPPWQSEAKLLIRYVSDARSPSALGSDATVRSPDSGGESIINTEIQILTSFDLAEQVADSVGAEKILAKFGGGKNLNVAAAIIRKNLIVEAPQRSSVIRVVFKHPDMEVVQPVLRTVIDHYFKTHIEIHRAGGILGNFLTQETDQLHSQLAQLETDLREARNKAGVLSVEDAKQTTAAEVARLRQEIFEAEADLAEHQAALTQFTRLLPGTGRLGPTNEARAISSAEAQSYRKVCARLKILEAKESELLNQFTEETSVVQDVHRQIIEAEDLKKKLEEKNPNLALLGRVASIQSAPETGTMDNLATESARAASLESRIKVLNEQLQQIRSEAGLFNKMEPAIQELERKKDLTDSHYRNLSASLEQYHIDDALGAGKGLNISKIQAPTPPYREAGKQIKTILMLIVGGFICGIGGAFAIDRFLDQSVKRPQDFEIKLGLPLFLSIPDMTRKSRRRINKNTITGTAMASKEGTEMQVVTDGAAWDQPERMRLHCEALGGRLIANLQARGVSHKPKMIAVTGAGRGTGVTTIAVGLAASLSETGDGRVLLVDMNAAQGAAQKFYKGKPTCKLEVALEREGRNDALVQDNLYVVAGGSSKSNLQALMPKQLASLLPKLRASDYDYIVFDLPPVNQTSITPQVARLMDIIVFAVGAEKTNLKTVQQANSLLEESGAQVGFVLNKTRSYVPSGLLQDAFNDV